jgi:hypothetical protein
MKTGALLCHTPFFKNSCDIFYLIKTDETSSTVSDMLKNKQSCSINYKTQRSA